MYLLGNFASGPPASLTLRLWTAIATAHALDGGWVILDSSSAACVPMPAGNSSGDNISISFMLGGRHEAPCHPIDDVLLGLIDNMPHTGTAEPTPSVRCGVGSTCPTQKDVMDSPQIMGGINPGLQGQGQGIWVPLWKGPVENRAQVSWVFSSAHLARGGGSLLQAGPGGCGSAIKAMVMGPHLGPAMW